MKNAPTSSLEANYDTLNDFEYVNRCLGKIGVYFNGNLILKRSYRSLKQRIRFLDYYTNVFSGYQSGLSFHIQHSYQNRKNKSYDSEGGIM